MVARAYEQVLQEAIDDLASHGYDSADRIAYWSERIRDAAQLSMRTPEQLDAMLREAMTAIYQRLIDRGIVIKNHPGLKRFHIDMVAPQLRGELDRRIMAATDLIRLNRDEAVRNTLHRFQGWSTSIPKGGSDAIDKRGVAAQLKKPIAQQKFEARRLSIDQGHKLVAAVSETLALGNNALAMIWKSHYRQPGYNYREEHKERDGNCYAIRGNWALDRGLMRAGPHGYYDEITGVGIEPFCRCKAVWLYNLSSLPSDMLTEKGRAELERVRAA